MGTVYGLPFTTDATNTFQAKRKSQMSNEELNSFNAVLNSGLKVASYNGTSGGEQYSATMYAGTDSSGTGILAAYPTGYYINGNCKIIGDEIGTDDAPGGWFTSRLVSSPYRVDISSFSNIVLYVDYYATEEEARLAVTDAYPITYSYTNSTVSGPNFASVGDTVVVSAVPDVDYGITDPTTQIAVTNNDDPVNFTWDASTNRITFTMPDPT